MSSGHGLLQTKAILLKAKDNLLETADNGKNELRSTGPN